MIHKTTRSILSVLLAALLLVTSIPLTPAFADGGAVSPQSASGEGSFAGGTGAANDPYQIATADDLLKFAKLVNDGETTANAELTANIDLSEICSEESDTSWTPIGNSSSNSYRGTFNGANYTISGLYINRSADCQGLFGYVSGSGKIEKLSVSGTVSGGMYVGGVVGLNSGSVEDCDFTGSVSGGYYVGGVVGANGGNVINCAFSGSVSGNSVGGVVGYNHSSVTNCYNTGSVSGPDSGSGNRVGGVVGWNDIASSVSNCYNTGTVTGTGTVDCVGGVVGDNSSIGNVKNCYNTGKVTGSSDYSYIGGVVGNNDGTVTDCYFLQQDPAIDGIGNENTHTGATVVDNLTDQDQFKGWDFIDTWRISQSLNRPVLQDNAQDGLPPGLGTEASPYEISTATQLKNFATAVNDGSEKSAHAKLMNNIDLSSVCGENAGESGQPVSWTPIGNYGHQYTGTFNGNGHTISGLYINNSANDQGLFGRVNGGTVQNLTVSGSVKGDAYVGGVVGRNNGTVKNCYNTGEVSGNRYVGGVVGENSGSNGVVENCHNAGKVSGSNTVGGVVGNNSFSATVTNCYNTGNVSGPDSVNGSADSSNVGGVVGQNNGSSTVENSYNTGAVSGGEYVGGVVGYNHSGGSVTNSYNTGAVSGLDSGTGNRVGGVVGDNNGGSVTNSYNTGSVSGNQVGGVVGLNGGIVENCYNTGTVTGTDDYVGGVVGYNDSGTVTDCYFLQQDPAIYGIGNTTKDDISQTAAKSLEDFHSGEVAYLLQSKQTDESGLVWGQTLGGEEDSLPTLVALNPDAAKEVYQLTFDWSYGGAPEGTTTTTNVYTNGSVAIPEINHDRTGYHISGWKDKNGQPVTAGTTVGEDADFTAEWTANTYTITVTAGSGGTVSGGGNVTHGDSVEVTATANQGYHFVNWTENGTEVSTSATYSFTATANRTLTANFAADAVEPDPTPTPTPTPDPTPSGPSTGDSSGWDDIRDELENTAKGDEITIDMGDETKVPAEIFESLAGKDVDVTFDLGDIQWSVNGADIPTDTDFTDLDLGASLGTSGIPVNVINTITGEVGTVQITLAHDGEFGFTMTLTAPLGKENAGYWANLYHYDEDAEALNFEAAAKIDEDGSVAIPFSHASQYAIVIDTHSHATVDVSDLFIDIAPDAWYKDAVQYAYDNGLMTGVSATEFAPEATTTRAMIVSILARLENVTTAEAAGFADVDDNDWYATAVNWAANVGVVNGYEDNTFRPNTAITREQLAAILMNYAAYKGEDVSNRADLTNYTDQPSAWAEEAISWSVAEGLLTGVTADTLQPQGAATRAQVAAILQRFLSE